MPGHHIGNDPTEGPAKPWSQSFRWGKRSSRIPRVPAQVRGGSQHERLRVTMMRGDAAALAISSFVAQLVLGLVGRRGIWEVLVTVATTTAVGLWVTRAQGLWLRRVCEMRTIELARLTRVAGVLAVVLLAFDRLVFFERRVVMVLALVAAAWTALVTWRSILRLWLTAQRRAGRHLRSTVIVGANREAEELFAAARSIPEQGVVVIAVVGEATPGAVECFGDLLVSDSCETLAVVEQFAPDCVVVCNPLLDARVLNEIIDYQHARDCEVMLDPGIGRINFRDVRFAPVAYEPFLYVEKTRLSRLQMLIKRGFDMAVSALMLLVLGLPMLAISLAVKLSDGGPVFFRQVRVGRDGTTFRVLKFRTMVVEAEARLDELKRRNERNGPLFKMDDDPRVTRIGRFLRDSSLDELPQLFNVLSGQMSLVGPRPALPSEVLEFSSHLRRRELVTPGITGLWQVEARDSPSFESYERLDLYYLEHWSLALDLVILVGTAEQVLLRLIDNRLRARRARRARREMALSPAVEQALDAVTEPIGHAVAVGADLADRVVTGRRKMAH